MSPEEAAASLTDEQIERVAALLSLVKNEEG